MESSAEDQKYYWKRVAVAIAFMGASGLAVMAGSHLNEDVAIISHADCASGFEQPQACVDSLSNMALAGQVLAEGGQLGATASFIYGSLAGLRLAKTTKREL